jgi:hypothetical protein
MSEKQNINDGDVMKMCRRSRIIVLSCLICLHAVVFFVAAEDKIADVNPHKYQETIIFRQDFEKYPVGEKKIEDVYGYPQADPPDIQITDQAHSSSKRALKVILHPELKKDHTLNFSKRFSVELGSIFNISMRVKLQDIKGGQPWQTPLIRASFYDKKNIPLDYVNMLTSIKTTEAPADDNWVIISQDITPKENVTSGMLSLNIYDGHDVGGTVYLDDVKITRKTPMDANIIWQVGGTFIPFNTYDLAENTEIKTSPCFDVKTHTFTYRLPDAGGFVTGVIPKGLGAISSTYLFCNEIPTALILKWKENEAGTRRLEIKSGFYRKMHYERGDLRAEFSSGQVKYWDFAKSCYDKNKAAWQNVGPLSLSAVFEVKPGENSVKLDFLAAQRGDNILFDSIRLVNAKDKELLPPVLEFNTGKLGNVFDVSEKVTLTANIYNCNPGQKSNFSYTIKDYFNQAVAEENVNFTADSSGKAKVEISPAIHGTGYFLLTPSIAGKKSYVFDFVRVVKADVNEKVDYDKSHFGTNLIQCEYGLKNTEMYEKLVLLTRQAGATWTRFNSIAWRWMEGGRDFTTETANTADRPDIIGPDKRWYNWKSWDDQIDIAHKHGFKIMATFLTTPDWAKKYPGKDFSHMGWHEPPRPAEYADFVGKTVSRYKDKIKYWEIWNEAYWQGQSDYWGGSPEDYGDIQKAAYPVIKQIDPAAKVLCTSSTGGLFQEKFIARAGLDTFDINNEHYRVGYKVNKELLEWWKERGMNKPAWSTETFSFVQPLFTFENSDKKAAGMWKIFITDWAAGMEKTFYWLSEFDCLNDLDLHATVLYPAFRALTHRLEGAEYINHNFTLGEGVEAYIFKNKGEMLTAIWAGAIRNNGDGQEQKEISFNVGVPMVKIIDIMDNEREALTENGVLRIKAGYVPFIVKGGDPEAVLLPTALRVSPENVFIMAGKTDNYEIRFKNIYQTALKGTISVEGVPPGWKVEPEKKDFDLHGLGELIVPVKITPAANAGHNLYNLNVNANLEDKQGSRLTAPLKVGTVDTPFGANLLSNSGFEEGKSDTADGWIYGQLNQDVKFSRETGEAHSGKYSVKFHAAQKVRTGSLLIPNNGARISVLPGEVYILSNWCKGAPAMKCSLHMRQYSRDGKYVSSNNQMFFYQPRAEGWKRTVNVYVVPDGIFSIDLGFVFESIQGTIYLDDFSFCRFRGNPVMNKILYELHSPKAAAPLSIDGDDRKWQKIEKAFVNDISAVRKSGEAENLTGDIPFDWRGKDDLRFEFATQWDENNLYLWLKVKDDVFCQPFAGIARYKGDSAQIAMDPVNAGSSINNERSELIFSTNPEGKIEVYQNTALPNPLLLAAMRTGLMKDWKVIVKRDESKKETIYEAAIPFLVFGPGFKPKAGESIGFSLLVNDNDGQGRRGWMEWSGGIGKIKDSKLFGSLIFME